MGDALVQADKAPVRHGENQEEEEGEVEKEVEKDKEEDNNQTPVRMTMDGMK